MHYLGTKLNQAVYVKLLASDEKCACYTNIDKVELFTVLHAKPAPLIRRRFDYAKDQETRRFKATSKEFGPDTKLESKREFLLPLMKLRLGLLGKDITHRFGISNTLSPRYLTHGFEVRLLKQFNKTSDKFFYFIRSFFYFKLNHNQIFEGFALHC